MMRQPNSLAHLTAEVDPDPRDIQSIDDLPPYADVQQVATFLGQSVATVRYWVTTGYIPSLRLGKSRRFSREALRDWLGEQESGKAI